MFHDLESSTAQILRIEALSFGIPTGVSSGTRSNYLYKTEPGMSESFS